MTTVIAGISETRTTIALAKETINKLKQFCKSHHLRMYEALDVIIDLIVDNDKLQSAIVDECNKRRAKRLGTRSRLSQNVSALPKELQSKLKAMSPEQLQTLLERMDQV
ncbi:MAG: hypothetical protein ACXWTU_00465 [Methylotenera sp.]